MGLIMLILIGTVPTAYALNRALPDEPGADGSSQLRQAASAVIEQQGGRVQRPRRSAPGRHRLRRAAIRSTRGPYPSLAVLVRNIAAQVDQYGSLARMPAEAVGNARNDMYLASEAIRFLMKDSASELVAGRDHDAQHLQAVARSARRNSSQLGEGRGGDRARAGHDGRMEAHRHHRRREDRQERT